jgi:hypothetical protein
MAQGPRRRVHGKKDKNGSRRRVHDEKDFAEVKD